ncbi:hypothetical protein, partial [Hallella sp.]|uniref:hypothetical protein n=1 Tax=Hallella sp. TaxID=2980186 RepID=UPI00307C9863
FGLCDILKEGVNFDTPPFFILRVDGIEDRAVGGYDEGAHADLLGRPDALRALLAVAAHGPWRVGGDQQQQAT